MPRVAPIKLTQTHIGQIWGGFEYEAWGPNRYLMPLQQLSSAVDLIALIFGGLLTIDFFEI